jgi:aldehyde:ferredoxin oxidoreductase
MNGWMGKILQVDLTHSKIAYVPTKPYAEKFLGGRGISSRLYWETVAPETHAFDPENRLIFMTGPLVGTGVQGATRMSVVSKSPMTYPEGFCYGNMGGFFGAELKRAGYDGLVITGRAPKPVYLFVNDEGAELQDASHLWGQGAYATGEMLQETHGMKVRFVTNGLAGENLVRSAVMFGSHQSTATGGFGAVMGSKNFKAIAVNGSKRPSIADPAGLKELNRYTLRICKRLRLAIPPLVLATEHGDLLEVLGKGGCHQCGLECIRNVYRYGKKLEGDRRCQAMEYYLPWRYDRDDEPVETFFDAPTLANDFGICTFELQSMIDWFFSCHKAGVLTEEQTGLPLSKIGTREFLETLLYAIAHREGFGDILAEGLIRAGENVQVEVRAKFDNTVSAIGQNDLMPPRAIITNALLYPMEPRVHQPLMHEISFVNAAWGLHRMDPKLTPVTNKVYHDVARAFWGSEDAGDFSSYKGKALAAQKIQNRTYIKDSLGLCDFAWPITYSFDTPNHVGDPNLEAKLFNAVTGIKEEELDRCAERIANHQRAILVREGREVPEADFPLEFNFMEPLGMNARGQKVMVPGPGDEVVDATGNMLDRDKFTGQLKEYYELRGWEKDTGLPGEKTLSHLGLEDLLPDFKGGEYV